MTGRNRKSARDNVQRRIAVKCSVVSVVTLARDPIDINGHDWFRKPRAGTVVYLGFPQTGCPDDFVIRVAQRTRGLVVRAGCPDDSGAD